MVVDRAVNGRIVGHWKSCLTDAGLNDDLAKLNEELSDIRLVNGGDRWSCIIDSDGRYTV